MADEFDALWDSAPSAPSAPSVTGAIPTPSTSASSFDDLWSSKTPVSALTSITAPQTSGRAGILAGGMTNLLDAMTLNSGDEIVAGGSSLLDAIFGGPGYDSRLNQARKLRNEFRQNNPITSIFSDISGAFSGPSMLFAPVRAGKAVTTTGKVLNTAKALGANTALGATAAGLTAGAAGFAGGEGGLEKRAESALGAATNPLALLLGAAAGGLGGAQKTADAASDEFLAQALNIQRSDVRKASKFVGKAGDKTEPLRDAIQMARKEGIFSGAPSAETVVERNSDAIETIGSEIKDLLKSAKPEALKEPVPIFNHAKKFIEDHPFDKTALLDQFSRREDTIADLWDGTVVGLQDAKQKLYKKAFTGLTDSKAFDQAIARDLKEAIENGTASALGKEAQEQLAALNKKQGQHLALRDILEKNQMDEAKAGGVAKVLRRATVSPVGGGALGVGASLLTGNPLWAGAGLLASGLASRRGQFALSDLARAVPDIANQAAGKLGALSALGPPQEPEVVSSAPAGGFVSPADLAFNALSEGVKPMSADSSVDMNTLVKAVIAQESAGNPNAVSDVGAQGLMQLMPATGEELFRKSGLEGKYNPLDPQQNQILGTMYLQQMLDRFGGDPELALTAYHSGPGRVANLLAARKGSTLADILDGLGPVGKKYAKQVLERYSNLLKV